MEIHSTIKPDSPQRIRGNLDTFTVIPPILATICSTGRHHVERGVGVEDVAGVERVASAERGLQRGIQISAHSQDAVDVRVMGAVRFPVWEPYRTTMVRSPPSWSAGMGFVEELVVERLVVHLVALTTSRRRSLITRPNLTRFAPVRRRRVPALVRRDTPPVAP